jgi:hypothetical protein
MSHFCVLVVGDNVHEQMAPFIEQVEAESEYASFNDQTEEHQKEYDEESTEMVKTNEGLMTPWEYERRVKDGKLPAGLKEKKIPFKNIYKTFAEFCEKWHGSHADEDGNYGYWFNPDAKWDWYQIGGRWHGFFWQKRGADSGEQGDKSWCNEMDKFDARQVDSILKKDVDLEAMRAEDVQQWTASYEKAQKEQNKKAMKWLYDIEPDETLEALLERKSKRHPCQSFAVLWKGEWIEEGRMGWFGMVSGAKDANDWTAQFNEIWKQIPEDTRVTIVDCHI